MKSVFLLAGILLSTSLSVPQKKARELCDCLIRNQNSEMREYKVQCMELRERIKKELGAKTPEYRKYLELTKTCPVHIKYIEKDN